MLPYSDYQIKCFLILENARNCLLKDWLLTNSIMGSCNKCTVLMITVLHNLYDFRWLRTKLVKAKLMNFQDAVAWYVYKIIPIVHTLIESASFFSQSTEAWMFSCL